MRWRQASHWPVMAGLLTSGWTTSIRWMPLSVASSALAVAHDVLALEQHFDDGGAGGRRAQAGLFHGVGEFFFIERLAGGFHGGEQGAFGEALGGAGLLAEDLGIEHVLRLALASPGAVPVRPAVVRSVRPSSPLRARCRALSSPICCTALPEVW